MSSATGTPSTTAFAAGTSASCGSGFGSGSRASTMSGSPTKAQGAQFTSTAFSDVLKGTAVAISVDGKGRWVYNAFSERLLWGPILVRMGRHIVMQPIGSSDG